MTIDYLSIFYIVIVIIIEEYFLVKSSKIP